MRKVPEILSAKTVALTRLFRIERVGLRFSNGNEVEYERMPGSTTGAVLIIPVLPPDTALLIREYMAGTHRYELGLPKGRIERGEDVLTAANRELMEEVGYGARELLHLTTMTLAPGYLGHSTHIVLAEDLYEQRLPGDEPEEIEVVPWPLGNLAPLLAREDFTEARSIASLFLVRDVLAARQKVG